MDKPRTTLRTWLFAAVTTAALGFGGSQALAATPGAAERSLSCSGVTPNAACAACCAQMGAREYYYRAPSTCLCGFSPVPAP